MVEKVNVGVRVWIGVVVVVVGMGQIRNVLMDGRGGSNQFNQLFLGVHEPFN